MVLHRLDRLTLDEARTTAVQTLEVVYGLVQNMRVVMDSESTHSGCYLPSFKCASSQTARHPLMVFGKPSVGFVRENKLILGLTKC